MPRWACFAQTTERGAKGERILRRTLHREGALCLQTKPCYLPSPLTPVLGASNENYIRLPSDNAIKRL